MFQPVDPWLQHAFANGARYALQLLGVLLVAILLTLMSPDVPEISPWRWLNLTPTLVGFPLALTIVTLWRSVSKTGMWIWVLPNCMLWYEILFVGTYRPLSYRIHFEFFGNDPIGLLFLTYPALTTAAYSFGMFVAMRFMGLKPSTR